MAGGIHNGTTLRGAFEPLPLMPRTELEPGTEFAGYRIEEVIGRGGMGIVYRAEHLHLGRTVALKLMPPAHARSDEFRQRFVSEARLAASINHPNVITVFDAGDAEDRLYIAMEHVDGTDLRALLEERGAPLDGSETGGIITAVAKALDAAHAGGLVHRDVKPANVLLAHGHTWLTDFGLTTRAARTSGITNNGMVVGTPDYVAPEQIKNEKVDGRADVYALGCVAFQCLTGQLPFEADSDIDVLRMHVEAQPPAPTAYDHGLPAAVDAVIARALAKDPRDRWPTASAFAAALRVALGFNRRREDFTEAGPANVLVTVDDPATYAILRVALARGDIEVVSATGQGSVPQLALVGDDPVPASA